MPRRIIEIVEIVLSTSFCAVPALRRVDPAMNSGPTTTAISWSTSAPSSEADAATTHAVSAPALLAALDRTEHVRRGAARADADDGIRGGDRQRLEVPCSGRAVVLGGCLRERGSGLAARDERHDRAWRGRERRFALGCVERRDPTGRAGANVDEAAARAQSLGDGVHRRRDG